MFNRLLIPASIGILWMSAQFQSGADDYSAGDWQVEPAIDPSAAYPEFVDNVLPEDPEPSGQQSAPNDPADATVDAVAETNPGEVAHP